MMKKTQNILKSAVIACLLLTACTNTPPSLDYTLPASEYQPRLQASDPTSWKPVDVKVTIPTGGVTLSDNGVFKKALELNINYLMNSFSTDHLLYAFRKRHGESNPPDDRPQVGFWDTDLRGSNAGRFMMGAGNTLRWMNDTALRKKMDELIDGIEACREPNGYILAYPPVKDSLRSEEPNYARAWFTHGLIDAAIAGNPKAYGLLRAHADWFNQWDDLHPLLLHWENNSHQGHIASTRTYLSPVGKPEDLQVAEKFYVCDWWMDELAARHKEAVWQYPLQNPHSYLITSFEAYLDHYLATGDKRFLEASLGAWELIHDNWEHVGGSMAICESQWAADSLGYRSCCKWGGGQHAPQSYLLTAHGHTGENCGSAFWIKFNQRLHRLFPDKETYMNEIEKSIYNVIIANQTEQGEIIYHANMEGKREHPQQSFNTCCEGQGTRLLGSLPEYIYSVVPDGLYVNLYEPSAINWKVKEQEVRLTLDSHFPYQPEVSLHITTDKPVAMKLHIRVPQWATGKMDILVNGKKATGGSAGTYVTLSRKWQNGDRIDFTLPMDLRFTKYHGADEDAQYERYAAEFGPILLACASHHQDDAGFVTLASLTDNLLPDPAHPLHFRIVGEIEHSFVPYWKLNSEHFTVYPILKPNLP
ncbi:MAG: glycoside hydrolase family 127 protein [Bacteroidales bacterium]|jgi:DUF1680 family protein|nr:glycoside hydrolase family 127 protein [Bacteroidales bacterium]